jgi:hypothetical protein
MVVSWFGLKRANFDAMRKTFPFSDKIFQYETISDRIENNGEIQVELNRTFRFFLRSFFMKSFRDLSGMIPG